MTACTMQSLVLLIPAVAIGIAWLRASRRVLELEQKLRWYRGGLKPPGER